MKLKGAFCTRKGVHDIAARDTRVLVAVVQGGVPCGGWGGSCREGRNTKMVKGSLQFKEGIF